MGKTGMRATALHATVSDIQADRERFHRFVPIRLQGFVPF